MMYCYQFQFIIMARMNDLVVSIMMLAAAAVVVAADALTTTCGERFIEGCNQTSDAECCGNVAGLYLNEHNCLCSFWKERNVSTSALVNFFNLCKIDDPGNNSTAPPCSGYLSSGDDDPVSPSPQPSVVTSPSSPCRTAFNAACSNTSGTSRCCSTAAGLYKNNFTCLCSTFKEDGVSVTTAINFFDACKIDTGNTVPCSKFLIPTTIYANSPSPSVLPSPDPPAAASDGPPPSSVVPGPSTPLLGNGPSAKAAAGASKNTLLIGLSGSTALVFFSILIVV